MSLDLLVEALPALLTALLGVVGLFMHPVEKGASGHSKLTRLGWVMLLLFVGSFLASLVLSDRNGKQSDIVRSKLESSERQLQAVNIQLETARKQLEASQHQLERTDKKVESNDRKLDSNDKKLDELKQKFGQLEIMLATAGRIAPAEESEIVNEYSSKRRGGERIFDVDKMAEDYQRIGREIADLESRKLSR